MNILMSAFACEPNRGSEEGNGWYTAVQAARSHEVWVLTRAKQREAIERHLQNHPEDHLHFIFVDLPRFISRWQQGKHHMRLYYVLWQVLILPIAYAAVRRHQIDVIHHVTTNTIDVPGFLWLLRRPFVWGPVGGGQLPPTTLRAYYGRGWRKEQLRKIRKWSLHFDPIVRLAIKRAAYILAANADTEQKLRKLGARHVARMVDVGVNLSPDQDAASTQSDDTFSIVWVGLLEPRKAPILALDVLRQLLEQGVDAQLWMIGDGPLRGEVEHAASSYGIEQKLHLAGRVPHPVMRELYAEGDVFLFTSLQDTSGTVVLEAMAAYLPVVALNHQGSAEMVTEETGILVSIESKVQVVRDLAAAIATLKQDPIRRRTMGHAARNRVENVYSWDRRGEFLRSFYADILEGTQ